MDYLKFFALLIFLGLLIFSIGLRIGGNEKEVKQTSENIVYHNNSSETTNIRYKYELGYESVSELEVDEDPIYTLYVNDEVAAEAFTPVNLPVVSSAEKVGKRDVSESEFYIEFNEGINKEAIRIDVKIVVEELKGGKWAPVYQAILMERGPYWSLDKGPIEVVK